MKYDLVCFDLDGTLVDTFPFIIHSYKKVVIDKYGEFKETEKDITAQIGIPIKYFFANYPEQDRQELQDAFASYNDNLQSKGVPFFKGVKKMLCKLKKQVKIGIVTSKRNLALIEWLKKEKLMDFFDVLVGRNDTELHKPNKEPLEYAMKISNISKDRILYVGDAIFDIQCAKNAKVDSCLVGWTALTQEEITQNEPTYILKKPKDIFKIIK